MRPFALLVATAILLAPSLAFASFASSADTARQQVSQLTQQQLDNLNERTFSDAFLTAKIIGYDRSDIDQLKADVAALKQENAQLRAQLSTGTTVSATTDADTASLEARVTKLEGMFKGLQDSLVLLLNMISGVLTKLE
jgi:hypothetical protein